jgi:integrase
MRIKLTKRTVEALAAPAAGTSYYMDAQLPGFCCRVAPTGRRTFTVIGTTAAGKQIKLAVGIYPRVTVEQARTLAQEALGKLAAGKDISEERRAARAAERARLAAPNMRELCAEYMSAHAALHKRPSSQANDQDMISRIILPAWGSWKAADVRRSDVEALHRKMRDTPYQANRVLGLLSKMFNLGIAWGAVSSNPARGVARFQEYRRERYLTPDEISRLAKVLATHPERASANAVRLLLLTGARRGEILGMRWDELDLDSGVWIKPASRTKQRALHRVPLSPAAIEILREIKTAAEAKISAAKKRGRIVPQSQFVFPSGDEPDAGPIREIKKFWSSVCRKSGIKARLHDLRHTNASILASAGMSLPLIGALLGHSNAATTQRYAHLQNQPLRAATGMVADKIAEYAAMPAKGEVVQLKG